MSFWFFRGLKKGIVTTSYPKWNTEEKCYWNSLLPTVPAYSSTTHLADHQLGHQLVNICPSNALKQEGQELYLDKGACSACGRCIEQGGGTLSESATFELATTKREALISQLNTEGMIVREVADEIKDTISRTFKRSLHIRTVDTGSCAVCESEIRLLSSPYYDLHRLGFFFTPFPRHADLLMITGVGTRAADQLLRKTYQAMPDPKITMAVGACSLEGVLCEDDLVHGALDKIIPIDVYVPGCPPSPLALLNGLLMAVGKFGSFSRNGNLGKIRNHINNRDRR
ncbi:MAG: hypothetical protein M1483_08405 [Actinobacteria bacterium]|nr:hypothetical protein [Actinomycetota bacterium]